MSAVLLIYSYVIHLVLASFYVCTTYRLVNNISVIKIAHSFCDNCNNRLNFIQLIPILGTLIHRGKCPKCRVKYSLTSFWFEITYPFFVLLIAYKYVDNSSEFITVTVIINLLVMLVMFILIPRIRTVFN